MRLMERDLVVLAARLRAELPRGWSVYAAHWESHAVADFSLRQGPNLRVAYYMGTEDRFAVPGGPLAPAPPQRVWKQRTLF